MRPAHVAQLEWHCQSRAADLYITSHSWLQVRLSNGASSSLEFSGGGFVERMVWRQGDAGTLYGGRHVASFEVPVTGAELRALCHEKARRSYSTCDFNCHMWALEVWNAAVPPESRCWTYPDQWKASAFSMLGCAGLFTATDAQSTGVGGGVLQQRVSTKSDPVELSRDGVQ